jgi:hypothetical protein
MRAIGASTNNLLTVSLAESHVVYTRMYPRYKSQGEMQIAVDQFSHGYKSVIACAFLWSDIFRGEAETGWNESHRCKYS